MNIRPFEIKDFACITDIYARSKPDEFLFEKKTFTLLPLERDNQRLSALIESDIYVYDEEGVRGYVALYERDIRSLFVHPDHRGRGIGKELLQHAVELVQGETSLQVVASNAPAKTLYLSFGFKVVDEVITSYNGLPVLINRMMLKQA